MWSATKCSRKGGGCHEANDRSCGNGCALSGRFSSCTEQGFCCDWSAVVPTVVVFVFLGSVCLAVAMGSGRPLSNFDELLSIAVLTASW